MCYIKLIPDRLFLGHLSTSSWDSNASPEIKRQIVFLFFVWGTFILWEHFILDLKNDKDVSVVHDVCSYSQHFLMISNTHTQVQKQSWMLWQTCSHVNHFKIVWN